MYHGYVLDRADIQILATLIQIRRDIPHGAATKGWSLYASESKIKVSTINVDGREHEERVDSRIIAEKLAHQFKATGARSDDYRLPMTPAQEIRQAAAAVKAVRATIGRARP